MQLAFRVPYRRLTLHSPLAIDQARSALKGQMADVPFFKGAAGKDFRGSFQGDSFRCSRVIYYRNLFLPVVQGQLVSEDQGTRVELVLRPLLPGSIFLSLWSLGILAVLVGGVFAGRGEAAGAQLWLLALPVLGLGIAIAGFAFGSEAVESERLLKRCLRVSPA